MKTNDYIVTLVGNALTALDDPDGIPDMDADTTYEDRIGYAIENLCEALRTLDPDTYS